MRLTLDEIQTKEESKVFDFKRELNVDTEKGKEKFVDDIVSFSNNQGGVIVIGVEEKDRKFFGFVPQAIDNRDAYANKLNQIASANTTPLICPSIYFLDMGEGAVIVIEIDNGAHKPYQNKKNGKFLFRGDGINIPMLRDDLCSLFRAIDFTEDKMIRLMDNDIEIGLKSGLFSDTAAILDIGLVPVKHCSSNTFVANISSNARLSICSFETRHDHSHDMRVRRLPTGYEFKDINFDDSLAVRMCISNTGNIFGSFAYPIQANTQGSAYFTEFKSRFRNQVWGIIDFAEKNEIKGPYFFYCRLRNIQSQNIISRILKGHDQINGNLISTDQTDLYEHIDWFCDMVSGCSIYK